MYTKYMHLCYRGIQASFVAPGGAPQAPLMRSPREDVNEHMSFSVLDAHAAVASCGGVPPVGADIPPGPV